MQNKKFIVDFYKKLFISGFLFLACLSGYGQFGQAADMVLAGDYEGAKNYYLKVLEKDSLNFSANQELGLLLVEYFDDKGEALFYLNRAIRVVVKKELLPELYLGFAQALHYDGQYKEAIVYYEKIIPLTLTTAKGVAIKNHAIRSVENCNYALKNPAPKNGNKYRVKNLGLGINTAYPEFLPIVDNENTLLLYTTNRHITLGGKKEESDEKTHGEMFISNKTLGKLESGLPFVKQNYAVKFLAKTNDHDAVVSVSTNGKRLIIYRIDGLYLSEMKDTGWTNPVRLPANINFPNVVDANACISNNGKTIFFSAVKMGGYGGKDLYRTILTESGEWTEPETLGEDINTSEDEDAPFLNATENTLYYSSKGLGGYGGYDIYKCKISQKGTYKPVNLGLPFNSPADDIYFSLNKNETEGYLSSSRKGGFGDLDIYHVLYFDKSNEANCIPLTNSKSADDIYVNFLCRDSVFVNDTVSFNAGISTIKNGNVVNYFWKINDTLAISDTSKFIKQFLREGKFSISLEAVVYSETDDSRKDYCITKQVHVFNTNVVDVFFEPLVNKDEDKLVIAGTVDVSTMKIDKTKKDVLNIKLEPVYYNTNEFELRKDAIDAINRNIAKMKVDATIVVKLTARTDPRATKEYNLKLSQKRANAVVAYLQKNGIKKTRIIAVLAVGEEGAIIRNCQHDPACLEKVYQENRRVDFKIVGAEYVAPKTDKSAKKTTAPKTTAKKNNPGTAKKTTKKK